MSPLEALRARRSPEGLPPVSTDDELVEWSKALVEEDAGEADRERPRVRLVLRRRLAPGPS